MEQLRFSLPEILSLFGVAQCVYVLVYMLFRSGDSKRAVIPFVYFLILGTAFFLDFAARSIGGSTVYYGIIQWFFWFMGPPLSVLLIIQIAQIDRTPGTGHYGVLFLTPLAYVGAIFMSLSDVSCIFPNYCIVLHDWLIVTGLIAGIASMVSIWTKRELLANMYKEKAGQDRYWLILTLVFVNLFFLAVMLFSLTPALDEETATMIRSFLGLGLVYLAGTSLFRIYPRALNLVPRGGATKEGMSADDMALALKIEHLLDFEKIYHESSYGRAELARELEVAETVISRVINLHFGKSFPQLLNERRVDDAKRLLRETDVPVKVVAEEVGFNSTASFNRVFKEISGLSPSAYRGGSKDGD